jgi:hypothetical protein
MMQAGDEKDERRLQMLLDLPLSVWRGLIKLARIRRTTPERIAERFICEGLEREQMWEMKLKRKE